MSYIGIIDKETCSHEQQEIKEETPLKETPTNNKTFITKSINHAVVPAAKVDLQKVAILFRKILLGESNYFHRLIEQKVILPKLLQTLLTTAIQKNAP